METNIREALDRLRLEDIERRIARTRRQRRLERGVLVLVTLVLLAGEGFALRTVLALLWPVFTPRLALWLLLAWAWGAFTWGFASRAWRDR